MPIDAPHKRAPRLQELRFQYQPVVALDETAPGGTWFEALVRWNLTDGTILGPLAVLPYWLGPTRRHAFTTFTVQQAALTLSRHANARLSINLSPDQLVHPGTVQALAALRPQVRERLVIELTEQRIADIRGYWRALEAIREVCGMIVLDDVSFDDMASRYRPGAPVDGVKLDRDLLPALLGRERHDAALALLERARERFGVIVAEGIEDPVALDALATLGISHVQGFGIGAPAPRLDAGTGLVANATLALGRAPAAAGTRAGGSG